MLLIDDSTFQYVSIFRRRRFKDGFRLEQIQSKSERERKGEGWKYVNWKVFIIRLILNGRVSLLEMKYITTCNVVLYLLVTLIRIDFSIFINYIFFFIWEKCERKGSGQNTNLSTLSSWKNIINHLGKFLLHLFTIFSDPASFFSPPYYKEQQVDEKKK